MSWRERYEEVRAFSEGRAAVRRGGYWDLVIEEGEDFFEERLEEVWVESQWGFVNEYGQEVVPCIYEEVWNFRRGKAVVKRDGKWGYVDKEGREFGL